MQVHVEIQRRPEALDEGDDAGSGTTFAGETSTVDEVGFDGSGDHSKRSRQYGWTARIKKAQRPGKGQNPLSGGNRRNDVVDQMG